MSVTEKSIWKLDPNKEYKITHPSHNNGQVMNVLTGSDLLKLFLTDIVYASEDVRLKAWRDNFEKMEIVEATEDEKILYKRINPRV